MQRCFGISRTLRRCGRRGNWRFFCDDHRRQPLVWASFLVFTVVAGFSSIYSAWWSDDSSSTASQPSKTSEQGIQPPTFIDHQQYPATKTPVIVEESVKGDYQSQELAFSIINSTASPITVYEIGVGCVLSWDHRTHSHGSSHRVILQASVLLKTFQGGTATTKISPSLSYQGIGHAYISALDKTKTIELKRGEKESFLLKLSLADQSYPSDDHYMGGLLELVIFYFDQTGKKSFLTSPHLYLSTYRDMIKAQPETEFDHSIQHLFHIMGVSRVVIEDEEHISSPDREVPKETLKKIRQKLQNIYTSMSSGVFNESELSSRFLMSPQKKE